MVLTRVHVKIHSAVRYRPFVVKIAFHVPNFCIIIILKYVFRNTKINVTKLPLCNRSSLTRCWCYGALFTGTVGCFALYPRNLLLNTITAHSVKTKHQTGRHPYTPKSTIQNGYEEFIRSLNHLNYISSDQSHSVRAMWIKPLAKPFRLFSRVCQNCIIKTNVHSHLL